jgi:hypothetical protein
MTLSQRISQEQDNWTYPAAPTLEAMDLPRLLEEHSLATQRMCRAFDRGEIDGANHHRKIAVEIADAIQSMFAFVQEQADRRAAA